MGLLQNIKRLFTDDICSHHYFESWDKTDWGENVSSETSIIYLVPMGQEFNTYRLSSAKPRGITTRSVPLYRTEVFIEYESTCEARGCNKTETEDRIEKTIVQTKNGEYLKQFNGAVGRQEISDWYVDTVK